MADVQAAGSESKRTSAGAQSPGRGFVNGEMPYFRFHADSWRARLSGLTAIAQLLIVHTAATGWSETKSGVAYMTKKQWARLCGCTVGEVVDAISQLADLPWLSFTVEAEMLTIEIPDISKQATIVTHERDKKRGQRAREKAEKGKGQSQGRIDQSSELRESELSAGRAPAPSGPSAPASEEVKHAALASAFAVLGKPRQK